MRDQSDMYQVNIVKCAKFMELQSLNHMFFCQKNGIAPLNV